MAIIIFDDEVIVFVSEFDLVFNGSTMLVMFDMWTFLFKYSFING